MVCTFRIIRASAPGNSRPDGGFTMSGLVDRPYERSRDQPHPPGFERGGRRRARYGAGQSSNAGEPFPH